MDIAEVLIKFKGDSTNVEEAQDKVRKSFDATKVAGEVAFAAVTTAIGKMVSAFVSAGIEYNAQMETFNTRLTTLTGSGEKADKVMQQIKEDALKTPFDVASLVQAQSLLLSTGLEADEARKDILALGDAISASGGGNSELQRMAVNLQQIKNVGKASSLDIKQFAFAGIDIYGLLADSLGVTKAEVKDLDITYEMLSKALQEAASEGGKYYKAMESQSKTYNGAMSNLEESVGVFKGAITEDLFGSIAKILPSLSNLFDWLTKNKDAILGIVIPILTFVGIFAGFMVISKVIALFGALWGVIMANPIVAIIAAIVGLVAGIIYLWKHCEAFRNFFIKIWNGIKKAFINVWNGIKKFFVSIIPNAFKNMGSKITKVWSDIKSFFANSVKSISTFFTSTIPTAISTGITFIIQILQQLPYYIGYAIGWIIGSIVQGIQNIWTFITVTIPQIITNIIDFIKELPAKILEILVDVFNKISEWVVNIWNKGIEAGSTFVNNVVSFVSELPQKIWTFLVEAYNKVAEWLSNLYNKTKQEISKLVKDIVLWFKELPSKMAEIGKNIVEGLWNGIKNAKDWLKKKIGDFATGVLDGIKDALGINSPSKEFALVGKFCVLGYTEALDDMQKDVQQQVNETFGISPQLANSSALNYSPNVIVNNNISMKQDPLGQMVNDIKTFSGGSKNDYNYGMGV